jgi:Mn-dependent DtxR family transcriptional regulator
MNLFKHLIEYQEAYKKLEKPKKFSVNEIALLRVLTDEPQTMNQIAEKMNVQRVTALRLIKRLMEDYGGIEVESFGRSAPSLYWKSDNFHTIYDEI